mmetsp:Transcript_14119/g.42519  ORF Transcript_14119/g.42519 Transcript_14119/m.42519 type:complete len:106 (+) Transcript_14119:373-690(+)
MRGRQDRSLSSPPAFRTDNEPEPGERGRSGAKRDARLWIGFAPLTLLGPEHRAVRSWWVPKRASDFARCLFDARSSSEKVDAYSFSDLSRDPEKALAAFELAVVP